MKGSLTDHATIKAKAAQTTAWHITNLLRFPHPFEPQATDEALRTALLNLRDMADELIEELAPDLARSR